jgi:hypothetical protein
VSDIFISYASEDRARVAPLAAALSGQGWSIWWDRSISAGRNFDEVIETELGAARVVIVAWSRESVQSRWVRAEAQEGLDHNKLIPVFLDEVSPPLIFRCIQAISLVAWDGKETAQDFRKLVADIGKRLGPASSDSDFINHDEPVTPAQPLWTRRAGLLKWIGAIGLLLAVVVAGYLYLQQGEETAASVTSSPVKENIQQQEKKAINDKINMNNSNSQKNTQDDPCKTPDPPIECLFRQTQESD